MDSQVVLWLAAGSRQTEHSLATSVIPKHRDSACTGVPAHHFPAGKVAVVAVVVCALSLICLFRRPLFEGNLAVVDAGRVIRSAQPTSQLPRLVMQYNLRSILNLRGGNPADSWYEAEVRTTQANALAYYDLPLSATRRPTRRELLFLIDIFERCPYPLLIHCKSGADRTGLASALYLMTCKGQPPEQAEGAFALEFGHIPVAGTQHLHEPLHEYADWLKARRLPHTAERFRAWVKSDYRSRDPSIDPPLWPTGPRPRRP
jgi:protein tyrosine phosphatase (PTP) superfamily phosphohydrolase (DUF442 family)